MAQGTKQQADDQPSLGLLNLITFVSDYVEDILLERKHETADQFFHRLETCLFGTVCTLPSSEDQHKTVTVSNTITSEYK